MRIFQLSWTSQGFFGLLKEGGRKGRGRRGGRGGGRGEVKEGDGEGERREGAGTEREGKGEERQREGGEGKKRGRKGGRGGKSTLSPSNKRIIPCDSFNIIPGGQPKAHQLEIQLHAPSHLIPLPPLCHAAWENVPGAKNRPPLSHTIAGAMK